MGTIRISEKLFNEMSQALTYAFDHVASEIEAEQSETDRSYVRHWKAEERKLNRTNRRMDQAWKKHKERQDAKRK
jgi:DNA anti-recombination protein RmuC